MSGFARLTRGLALSRRKLRQWVDLNRRFVLENLSRARRPSLDLDYSKLPHELYRHYDPCFVLSTGRCGTDFLTHVLELSPQLSVHHSPKPELRYYRDDAYRANRGDAARQLVLEEIVRASRFELLVSASLAGRRYVETNNGITFFAPQLARLFPRARFIHLVRHPADFARSGMRRQWYTGRVEADMGIPTNASDPEWATYPRLTKVGWLWNATNEFIRELTAQLASDRWICVRSEDLFSDPGVLGRIFSFLAIDPPSDRRLRRLAGRRVNEQILGHFPKYADWTPTQKASFGRFVCGHRHYGYSL